MFGGIEFLLDCNMLVGVWKDSLVARIGRDAYDDALLEPHVEEFDIAGKAIKWWVNVEPEGVEDDDPLAEWIRRAMYFVNMLPTNRGRRKTR